MFHVVLPVNPRYAERVVSFRENPRAKVSAEDKAIAYVRGAVKRGAPGAGRLAIIERDGGMFEEGFWYASGGEEVS